MHRVQNDTFNRRVHLEVDGNRRFGGELDGVYLAESAFVARFYLYKPEVHAKGLESGERCTQRQTISVQGGSIWLTNQGIILYILPSSTM